MGSTITAPGVTAPWNAKVRPPVSRGLEAWFTFDTDPTRFSFNRAVGKGDAIITGAPQAFTTHGRFKGMTNFLQTQVSETADQTIIVIGKAAAPIPEGALAVGDANTPYYVGNRYGASIPAGYTGVALGTSLYHRNPTTLTSTGGRLNSAGTNADIGAVDLAADVPTDWGIRAIRVAASGVNIVQNITRGIRRDGTLATSRILSDAKHRIGSATTSFGAEVDISAVAIYSAFLSDLELSQVVASMRKRMSRLGIAV